MNLHAPQLVILALIFVSLGLAIEQHGKPKTGNHSFWISLIAAFINFGVLYWGGFFTK